MIAAFLYFLTGHFMSALILYFIHRFVFHGKLRRLPILKGLAKLHGIHHANVANKSDKYIFVPLWINILLVITLIVSASINIYFSLGIATFGALYAWRHWAIHNHDFTSKFFHHHNYHHKGNTLKNFSGIYPFIDKIFNTYEDELTK